MRTPIFLAFFLTAGIASTQVGTVFNYVPGQRSPLDETAHQHFGRSYKVVDVGERERFVFPKGPAAIEPKPVTVRGRCLEGEVTVLYIIDPQGSVLSPYVAKTDNAILSQPALATVKAQHFEPAKLDGKPAAILAVTTLKFTCRSESKVKIEEKGRRLPYG